MTSPIAVYGIVWDGHDVQDIDGLHLDLLEGGPDNAAMVRGTDRIVPSRAGRRVGNRQPDLRSPILTGFVTADESLSGDAYLADYFANRLLISTWFVPDDDPKEIALTVPGGDVYTLNARPVAPFLINEQAPGFALVTIKLDSIDPDWILSS